MMIVDGHRRLAGHGVYDVDVYGLVPSRYLRDPTRCCFGVVYGNVAMIFLIDVLRGQSTNEPSV